jgi:hypothetical protein
MKQMLPEMLSALVHAPISPLTALREPESAC